MSSHHKHSSMTLFSKIKWVLGIVLIFVLVITTNLIDRQNFAIVNDSIETIYADRLVAQDIIYDLSSSMQEKKLLYLQNEQVLASGHQVINSRLDTDLDRFGKTRLTLAEASIFNQLKKEISLLKSYEDGVNDERKSRDDVQKTMDSIRKYLDDLSDVQMTEARRELHESKMAIASANLFTQLEIAALVIIAILVQVIILYTPKIDPDA